MNEPEVISNDPNAPSVPGGQGKDTFVPLTKEQTESLQRELSESKQATQFWANHAKDGVKGGGGSAPPVEDDGPNFEEFLDPEAAELPVIDGDTTEKMIDEFAKQGLGALTKRGMVTRAEALKIATEAAVKVAGELIGRERSKMSSDDKIMTEFPDLKNQDSELFKETSKLYREAYAIDPNVRKTPAGLFLAARAARDSIKARGGGAKPGDGGDDGGEESEEDRRARADSQGGRPRGGRGGSDDSLIGTEAKQVINGFGLTEAEFQESKRALGSTSRGRR